MTRGEMLKRMPATLVALLICMAINMTAMPSAACVEGLAWGMPLNQVQLHLGESLPVKDDNHPSRFTASDVLLDELPVSRVTFELDKLDGLRSLAYEFALDDMPEVLAGLQARHGQPLSTTMEARNHSQQIWVWNTGNDLITAVKRNSSENQQFLISYRPNRLHPETL